MRCHRLQRHPPSGDAGGAPLPDGTIPTKLPTGVTREQFVTYVFASRLLAAERAGNCINFGHYIEEYPQSLFKISLGSPLGDYYVVNGTHVYARDFSSAKVLVNPTYSSYTVNLDGNYETINGTPVPSQITVDPHNGIILKRA